jgi:LPS export ABC transporter protein LptC
LRKGAACFAAAALALSACGKPAPAPGAPAESSGPAPDRVIKNFTIDSFAGGERDWVLRAPKADFFESKNLVLIERPFVQFYEGEEPSSTLESGRGEIHTGSRDLWAWDEVVMVSTDGARLNSDWLQYVAEKDRIVSTAPVTIVRRGSVIRGVGWEAAPDLSEVFIKRQRVEIDDADRKQAR